MVRGGTINADESHNDTQSIIATHGRTSKTRHHNRSRKVRRENQQQQALGEPKDNAWARTEPPKMMMKIGKVTIVIMPFLQDLSRAIVKVTVEVKVKAVPKKRPMLSQGISTQEITGRDHKKKMPERQQQN
jgi:hypothetical protein